MLRRSGVGDVRARQASSSSITMSPRGQSINSSSSLAGLPVLSTSMLENDGPSSLSPLEAEMVHSARGAEDRTYLLASDEDDGDMDTNGKDRRKSKSLRNSARTTNQTLRRASRSVWSRLRTFFFGIQPTYHERKIWFDGRIEPSIDFVANVVRNQKYNVITFLPLTLYQQFKFFFNLYFLMVCFTQFIPALQVGFLFTYVGPLAFVLTITLMKEAFDDYKRFVRDREANSQMFDVLLPSGRMQRTPSSKISVGDVLVLHTNQRVPADCILLRTTEKSGSSFIRTDQLDGETDWKLRHPLPAMQKLRRDENVFSMHGCVEVEAPRKAIYEFAGAFTAYDSDGTAKEIESLSLENTMWCNTVIASGTVLGLVIYTGKETRAQMNSSLPQAKVGKLDLELNVMSKMLFTFMVGLGFFLLTLKGFRGNVIVYFVRYILLFSSIIPISLRVNLDMGKTLYSFFIQRDKEMPGTVVRNSTIPEELGRIEYLFSDKTGTLTRNEMHFKRLHMGAIQFSVETMDELKLQLLKAYNVALSPSSSSADLRKGNGTESLLFESMSPHEISDAVTAIALCHNVTPVIDDDTGARMYQASSPDEIALVKFSENVGVRVEERTNTNIVLKLPNQELEEYEILNIFPFTSESKRMGIIVRNHRTQQITFYMKGADSVMQQIVRYSDWLEEECDNMSREGLRTLVFGRKRMTEREYMDFTSRYQIAKAKIDNRAAHVQRVMETIERDMELVGVSGVEDRLQENIKEVLEMLRNAGISIWMLTGDKVETATCIAISARLISRDQSIYNMIGETVEDVIQMLDEYERIERNTCLVVDGKTLEICMRKELEERFVKVAKKAPSVVACRCSPTQKADVVSLVQKYTGKRTCSVGDGGNDVSMIQAANVGVGIVGKEGKQASLAADFSVLEFQALRRLLLWHGRNSYKRSARLSQFVIHRGLIISILQVTFCAIFYFAPIPIYTGWLMVGYATYYTMLPVFSLVMDQDVSLDMAMMYPELYHDLQKGRSLCYRTFLTWFLKAVYQGGVIMLLTIWLFEGNFLKIVSITYTALILTELLMVLFEVHHLNRFIIFSVLASMTIYIGSFFFLPTYFDLDFIGTAMFWWKVIFITACSVLPVYVTKVLRHRFNPAVHVKLES